MRRTKAMLEDIGGVAVQRLSRRDLLDRGAQPVGIRRAGGGGLPLQLQRLSRSCTISTACPRRRAFRYRAGTQRAGRNSDDHVSLLGRNLPCSGGGYFRLLPYAALALGAAPGELRERGQARHLLFPSLGDRSRPAADGRTPAETAAAPLHQPAAHGGAARPPAATISPGAAWTRLSPRSSVPTGMMSPVRGPRLGDRSSSRTPRRCLGRIRARMPGRHLLSSRRLEARHRARFGHRTHYLYAERDGASPACCRWPMSRACCSATR